MHSLAGWNWSWVRREPNNLQKNTGWAALCLREGKIKTGLCFLTLHRDPWFYGIIFWLCHPRTTGVKNRQGQEKHFAELCFPDPSVLRKDQLALTPSGSRALLQRPSPSLPLPSGCAAAVLSQRGGRPAAGLSGCRCPVPRARRGWPGSLRRCPAGRCRCAAAAGSGRPRPWRARRRRWAPTCTANRNMFPFFFGFLTGCSVLTLPSGNLLPGFFTALLVPKIGFWFHQPGGEGEAPDFTPWRRLCSERHSPVAQAFGFN